MTEPLVKRIDHLGLIVHDVEATCDFYQRVLGMQVVSFGAGRKALAFGQHKLNLRPDRSGQWTARRPAPNTGRSRPLPDQLNAAAAHHRPPALRGCCHRGRPRSADWRTWPDRVDLLPRPGRQPDRGLELPAGLGASRLPFQRRLSSKGGSARRPAFGVRLVLLPTC